MPRPRVLGLVAVVCGLATGMAHVAAAAELGRKRPEVVADWKERMVRADEKLRTGESRGVRVAMDDLLWEIAERLESGPSGPALLGQGLALRGLARAMDGDLDEAAWDWRAAQSFVPVIGKVNLATYGEAGRQMQAALAVEPAGSEEAQEADDGFSPPVRRRYPSPRYPSAKHNACLDGPIEVQVVIDEEGRPRRPEIVSSVDPILEYSALEALRKWRFDPARIDGEPVRVIYTLTVHYRVDECRNLAARARLGEAREAPAKPEDSPPR